VSIGARVPVALADAVQQLAERGNRTVSREVFAAIREHVDRSGELSSSHRPYPAASRPVPEENAPAVEAGRGRAGEGNE
jgi:hypothetical protein